MKNLRSILISSLLASMILAGCGGDGNSLTPGGGGGGNPLFSIPIGSPSADYSGDSSAFKVSATNFVVNGKTITASMTGQSDMYNRSLTLKGMGESDLVVGSVLDMSKPENVLTYSESSRANGDVFVSKSGEIEIKNLTSTSLTVEMKNVLMEVKAGNTARGSFVLNGTYTLSKIVVSIGEGEANLTFNGNGNVSLAPMNFKDNGSTQKVILTGTQSQVMVQVTQLVGTSVLRYATVSVFKDSGPIAEGDVFLVSNPSTGSTGADVTLTETAVMTGDTKAFGNLNDATGTVTVVSKTADGIALRLDNVLIEPGDPPMGATGAITVNGTVSGKFSTE